MSLLPESIDGPVAVIGDVHGHVDRLQSIVDQLFQLPGIENRWIVFIGDLIDRGPNSREVLDLAINLHSRHRRVTACAGNHEFAAAAALGILPTPDYSNWHERWVKHYNSDATFRSYGVEPGDLAGLLAAMPRSHQMFLKLMPWYVEHPQYLFVHAGLDFNQPYDIQRKILAQKDFNLNRPAWLCDKSLVRHEVPSDCPLTIVSGHVCVPSVEFSRRRVLLDTTGGEDGDLSCVLLPEKKVLTSADDSAGDVREPTGSGRKWWKAWSR